MNEAAQHRAEVEIEKLVFDMLSVCANSLDIAKAVAKYAANLVTTKARGSVAEGTTCDLCEEVVTEWEWVDKGWSLACKSCLEKIRAQAMERCAEIAEGFESPFSQEFPAEAWRGKLQTVILQALLGAPIDGDDTQPERAVAEAVFSFLQTGRDRMDELFKTGNASAAIRAEARRLEPPKESSGEAEA